jgi:hypothetical protein
MKLLAFVFLNIASAVAAYLVWVPLLCLALLPLLLFIRHRFLARTIRQCQIARAQNQDAYVRRDGVRGSIAPYVETLNCSQAERDFHFGVSAIRAGCNFVPVLIPKTRTTHV